MQEDASPNSATSSKTTTTATTTTTTNGTNAAPKQQYLCEGSAQILNEGNVFYNPVQQFNRDLSLSVISTFSHIHQAELAVKREKQAAARRRQQKHQPAAAAAEPAESGDSAVADDPPSEGPPELQAGRKLDTGLVILEALSATGLRSIRYAQQIPGVQRIVANDLSRQAIAAIQHNVRHNGVEHLVEVSHADAMTLMYTSTAPERRFTVIDLDPYGAPTRFLDGAVQALADGGLLCVTATDMAVLAGGTPEACYVKYGSIPVRSKACHEMALRILLRTIESTATRYGRYIRPLVSVSADFYIRIFVRVFSGPAECKRSSSRQSMVFQCTGCDTLTLQPLGVTRPNPSASNPAQVKFGTPTGPFVDAKCEHCGHRHHMGGPIWSDPIHDATFVEALLATIRAEPYTALGTHTRMLGMLSVIAEELHHIPLYYAVEKMCSVLKLEVVPILPFRSAILHAGYRVSFSHACKSSIKTDAPAAVLWDILRCWAKTHPVKPERFLEGSALKAILSREPTVEHNLVDLHEEANPASRKSSLARFPGNPAAHWGPGTRATLMIGDKMLKSIRNQNKNKKHGKRILSREEYLERKKLAKIADIAAEQL